MPDPSYLLTYAGIPFCLDTARVIRMGFQHGEMEDSQNLAPKKHQPMEDLVDQLNKIIPFRYLNDVTPAPIELGRNLQAIAHRRNREPETPEVKIGEWFYPNTASRWSIFRGLATSEQANAMVSAAHGLTGIFTTPPFSSQPGVDRPVRPRKFIMKANPFGPGPMAAATVVTLPTGGVDVIPGIPGALDENSYTLETDMYLLPPRPLAEHGGQFSGLYLITLVDERYWWQYTSTTLKIDQDTTWNDLIDLLTASLGITIGVVDIPHVYTAPEPDSPFWNAEGNAAVLLDAVAHNIGDVVVRWLDGSYKFLHPLESQTFVKANRGLAVGQVRTAGGEIFVSGISPLPVRDLTLARNLVIPNKVQVTFPWYVVGNDPVPHFINERYKNQRPSTWYEESYGGVYSVEVPIESGNSVFITNPLVRDFFPLSGLTGVAGVGVCELNEAGVICSGYTHSISNTAKAFISGEVTARAPGGEPLNQSGLVSLAMQLAADYWNWQVSAGLDEVYPGTFNWIPEGYHDIIWTYSAKAGGPTTRVIRSQWNQMIENMQHSSPPSSGFAAPLYPIGHVFSGRPTGPFIPRGVGGPSVAQTIRDSLTGQNLVINLFSSLAAADQSVVLSEIIHLPTQNRWRGKIEDELILFEGTSGGIAAGDGLRVDIVYRGIDGTYAADHPAGATIIQVTPSVAYGINLTTYEKGQFVYPSQWTSGGIMGLNVVPQIQTVYISDGSPRQISKIDHWSGVVQNYSPFSAGGGDFDSHFSTLETIWAIERNQLSLSSGRRYAGQFVGYSASGIVAPIYMVDNCCGSEVQVFRCWEYKDGMEMCSLTSPGPGWSMVGTATYPTLEACQAACSPFFCWRFPSAQGDIFVCSQVSPGTGWVKHSGPYPTVEACQIVCQAPPFFCWEFSTGERICSQPSPGLGWEIVLGPFPSIITCQIVCLTTSRPYFCWRGSDEILVCAQTQPTPSHKLVSGPHATLAECSAVCSPCICGPLPAILHLHRFDDGSSFDFFCGAGPLTLIFNPETNSWIGSFIAAAVPPFNPIQCCTGDLFVIEVFCLPGAFLFRMTTPHTAGPVSFLVLSNFPEFSCTPLSIPFIGAIHSCFGEGNAFNMRLTI